MIKTTRLAGVATAAALTFGALSPAAAASEVTVNAGNLSIAAPTAGDFTAVTLDGSAKTTTAALGAFSVTDARGSGAGWHVTAQATQFQEWDGTDYVVDGKTLANGSLSLSEPTVAANDTSSPVPTVNAGAYTIDTASAVTVASAATDTGMGTYDFSASTLTLAVPASAYAKTYRSTVTVDVVTGP